MNGEAFWYTAADGAAWLPLALVATWVAASGAIRTPEAHPAAETVLRRPRVALGALWAIFLAVCGVGVALLGVMQHLVDSNAALRLVASAAFLALALGQRGRSSPVPAPLAARFGDAVLATWAQPTLWGVAVAVVAGFATAGERAAEHLLLVAAGFALMHAAMASLGQFRLLRPGTAGWVLAAGLVWA